MMITDTVIFRVGPAGRRVAGALGLSMLAITPAFAQAPSADAHSTSVQQQQAAVAPLTSEEIKKVQQALQARGLYENGAIDGYFAPKTSAAVRQFQRAQGLPPTGSLTMQTLADLGLVSGAQKVGAGPAPANNTSPESGKKAGSNEQGPQQPAQAGSQQAQPQPAQAGSQQGPQQPARVASGGNAPFASSAPNRGANGRASSMTMQAMPDLTFEKGQGAAVVSVPGAASGVPPSQHNSLLTNQGEVQLRKMLGSDVYNLDDKKLGHVEEVLVGASGEPEVVIQVEGTSKEVAVPWSKFTFGDERSSPDNTVLLPGITKEALQASPAYHDRETKSG